MEGQHTLVVVRHAKADDFAPSDFERDLTERGRRDAADAGRWLASEGVTPGTAYVSAARRTRSTWEAMAEAAGWDLEPVVDSLLYSTDEDGVLEMVGHTPEDVDTVLVIGHNPTIGLVAQLLDDGEACAELSKQLVGGVPTCAVVVFRVDGPWAGLGPASGRLRAFHVGRGDS